MTVWLTDRNGAQLGDNSPAAIRELLDALRGTGDDEHGSVSVTDDAGWNLEFYQDSVLFENIEPGGAEVGCLFDLTDDVRVELATMLVAGDLETLNAQGWR